MTSAAILERARQAHERSVELRAQSARAVPDAEEVLAHLDAGSDRIGALMAEVAGLRRALESRATIEQAKGIIISRTGLGPDAAFELLVRQSQHENRKVREIAAVLVNAAVRSDPATPLRSRGE